MILKNITTFNLRICVIFAFFFLFASIFLISGCSSYSTIKKTTKKIVRDFKSSNGDLKKKVGIAFFENKTFSTDRNFEKNFQQNLFETIKKACPDILLVRRGDKGYPDILLAPPRLASGLIDNLSLIKTGRQLGFNAFVIVGLKDIKANEEQRGLLWFKDSHNFIQIQTLVEVYDTETGSKLLDERFVHDIEVDESESESIKAKKEIYLSSISGAMEHLITDIGEKICDIVCDQPWKGYVISTTGSKVVISSGKNAGLIKGDILEVYESVEIINGQAGQRFFIPGPKTGKIKITTAYPDRAEAISISEKIIKAGSCVKQK